jgi:hypothetical protein
MTYTDIENILKGINDPKLPQIYHFDDTPNESEFQTIFDFYSATLKKFSDYGFDPSFIYFNQEWENNALACKRGGYFIVSFNLGLIKHLLKTFDEISFISKNPNLDALPGTTINTIMYQSRLHFTLYHEMAHLVQNSKYLSNGLTESPQTNGLYDETKHLLELDADQFSSLYVAAHIQLYLNEIDDSLKKNPELEEHVLAISIAALMLHLLSFSSASEELYYKERSHPHASIRLSNIANTIIDYTYQARKSRSSESKEKTDILVKAGNIVQNSTQSNIVLNYVQMLVDNYQGIQQYLNSFVLLNNKETLLATDKRNDMIRSES